MVLIHLVTLAERPPGLFVISETANLTQLGSFRAAFGGANTPFQGSTGRWVDLGALKAQVLPATYQDLYFLENCLM